MSVQKAFAAIVVMMLLSVVGVEAAAAQDWRFPGYIMDLSVESSTGTIQLAGTSKGVEGYRYTPKPDYFYGKPLNSDGVTYWPEDCLSSYMPPQADLDYARSGGTCNLVVGFSNPTEHVLDWVRLSYEGDPADRKEVKFLEGSARPEVGPGEYVEFLIDVTYRKLGRNRDSLTVTGTKYSSNPEERFTFTDTAAYDYWVEPAAPSVPTGFGYVFTNNTYTLYWNPPINDGGLPVTGYLVELLEIAPLEPPRTGPTVAEQILNAQIACNFAGRPELTVCDLPNNQLKRIEGKTDYIFRLRALTDYVIPPDREEWAPKHHSELFYVPNTLGLQPSPEPEPTPADELVFVADFQLAPNLLSLVHASNYSNQADAPVLRLYHAYFNRQPDLNGAKYWLGIRRDGHDLLAIAGYMSDSHEFANNYSGVTDQEYLSRVYQNMLGRTYDQKGFNYWLDLLRGHNDFGLNPNRAQLSRAGVVFYMTAGEEFIANYPYT